MEEKRAFTPTYDTSAPTVSTKALMLSCLINTIEERDITKVDIPGASMQANMDKVVYMKLEDFLEWVVARG
eukprot:14043547-Ditylum_brightwellii.AAC.4